uniref:protein O-GlcNAc transferase n=1 Tax=Guillardia theta TaxID=55529 RepID=A0A7S4PES0_GUITH
MLMSAGFDEEAIQEYQVLAQSNDHEVAANSIGQLAALQNKKGEHGGAEQSYRKSIAMDPTNAQMRMNLAVILADQHRIKESFALFEEAIVMRPADHLTLSNFGTVLHRTGEFERSAQLYQRALQLLPGSANLHYNLGNSYMDIAIQKNYSLLRSAIQEYTECLSIQVTYPGAMNNLGNALKESDRFRDALRAWQTALRLEGPRQPDVFSNLVHLRMFVCDWDNWKSRYSTLEGILRKQLKWYETSDGGEAEQKEKAEDGRAAMMSKKKSVSCQPFHALLYAELDGDVVLKVAQSFAHQVEFSARHFRHFFEAATRFDRFPAFNDNKINVGYLSHDFGDHPTGHLFNGVPFLHQQSKRVRAFYFSLSGSDGSRYWKRLQRSTTSDQIADVTSLPFEEAASLINMRGIHVLVDLDVWMKGRRPEILALRPSPVQVVYLGYPGSSGAAYIDFLVSDKIVSPPEARALYSEHLVLLPGTYQVNDYKVGFKHLKQSLMREKELHTREFHELPKKGLLLGNFNQLYKIDPDTLDLWSAAIRKILSIAPASLWLLRFPSIATSRLIKELKKRGIERHQVHFSDRISKDSHLLRVHMADIFLDNHHVNAHTTASEAIWAGVPLVTWPGVAMASRVAASLLMSTATVSCLIARTQEDFLELVFALAISHHRRRALRQSMMQGSDLFDTERWVSSWETSLRLMVTAGMYAERGHVPHIVARRSS